MLKLVAVWGDKEIRKVCRRLAEDAAVIGRQRDIVEDLRTRGVDASFAESVLATLEISEARHRERLVELRRLSL